MKPPKPFHRRTAAWLLLQERPRGEGAGAAFMETSESTSESDVAARVYEKLFACLSPLIGGVGLRALFARSARLAEGEAHCLAALVLGSTAPGSQPDDQIGRLRECFSLHEEAAAEDAAVALFATFLSLLGGFIGDRLTEKVLRGVWPALARSTLTERAE